MPQKRPRTDAQKLAKNACDRRYRRKKKAEMETLREENGNLQNTVHQQNGQIQQLQHQNNEQSELIQQLQHQNNEQSELIQQLQHQNNEQSELIQQLQHQKNLAEEETRKLRDMVQNTVHQQSEPIGQLQHQKNLEEEETQKLGKKGQQNQVRKLQALVATHRHENRLLREEYENLKVKCSDLQNTLRELVQQQQQHQKDMQEKENTFWTLAGSHFDIGEFRSPFNQEENENLKVKCSDLQDTLRELVQQQQQQHHKNVQEKENDLWRLADSFFDYNKFPSSINEDAVAAAVKRMLADFNKFPSSINEEAVAAAVKRMLDDLFFGIDKFPSPMNEEAAAAANYESIAGGPSSHISSERLIRELEKPNPREEAERQRKGKAIQNHFSN